MAQPPIIERTRKMPVDGRASTRPMWWKVFVSWWYEEEEDEMLFEDENKFNGGVILFCVLLLSATIWRVYNP